MRIAHDDAAGGPTPAVVRHEVRLAKHDCRPRLLKILEIALRSKKREIVGAGPIERRDAGDGQVGGADEPAVRQGGDLARTHASRGAGSPLAGRPARCAFRRRPAAHGLGPPYFACFSRSITLGVI